MKISEIIESQDQNAIVSELQTKRYLTEPDTGSAEKGVGSITTRRVQQGPSS